MAGKKRPSSADAEDYESDGGFVEDAPKSKKAKTTKTAQKSSSAVKSETGGEVSGGGQIGKDGEVYWELGGTRRVGISRYSGKMMVSIREYYEKNGEMLPSKKGISLAIHQFNTLMELLPHIETSLADKGETLKRPEFREQEAEAQEVFSSDFEVVDPDAKPKKKIKKNHEATSDEEE